MKKPNKKAQEWFEEHEFELMNIEEYDHWINVVNAEKVTNAQFTTWKIRANKALTACLKSKKGADALANEISDFICNLEENKDCLVFKEVEEKYKSLKPYEIISKKENSFTLKGADFIFIFYY